MALRIGYTYILTILPQINYGHMHTEISIAIHSTIQMKPYRAAII